jgi:hypothetical protein
LRRTISLRPFRRRLPRLDAIRMYRSPCIATQGPSIFAGPIPIRRTYSKLCRSRSVRPPGGTWSNHRGLPLPRETACDPAPSGGCSKREPWSDISFARKARRQLCLPCSSCARAGRRTQGCDRSHAAGERRAAAGASLETLSATRHRRTRLGSVASSPTPCLRMIGPGAAGGLESHGCPRESQRFPARSHAAAAGPSSAMARRS